MKPKLLLSLPNSGSTWLAEILAQYWPDCRYAMEFFNPLRNPKYEDVLSRQFGCELISCYRNIAEPGDASIDADIAATWGRERYTFTKEVFSPLKLDVFARHFDCMVLLRTAANSFPPSRLRIWSFYEHSWFALRERGWTLGAESALARAIEAHGALYRRLNGDAQRLGIPVLFYEDLMSEADVVRTAVHHVGLDGLDALILGTRRSCARELLAA